MWKRAWLFATALLRERAVDPCRATLSFTAFFLPAPAILQEVFVFIVAYLDEDRRFSTKVLAELRSIAAVLPFLSRDLWCEETCCAYMSDASLQDFALHPAKTPAR